MLTIVEMLAKSVKNFPRKVAIASEDSNISYRELDELSSCVANYLVGLGVRKGDRVGFLVKKTPEAIISFLGSVKAGGIFFPIDYYQTVSRIQDVINLTDPAALVVSADLVHLLPKLRLGCSENHVIFLGKESDKKFSSWEKVLSTGAITPPCMTISKDDIAYLNFTSGTTGVPKAATATHANIYWNTLAATEGLGLTSDDIHLCLFPVFGHPHEIFARPLYLGGTMVLIDSISPKAIAKSICDHEVTCVMAVASIYTALVRFHSSNPFDFSSVRIPESGGMHITPYLREDFETEFNVRLFPVWGSTETMGIALSAPIDGVSPKAAMGKPCPYYEIKVVGKEGNELPPNEIGEMIIKGPAVSSGYFSNTVETQKYIKSGWFFTGDLVKRDINDYFYFASRKSGMMKVAGMKVFPSEVENILSAHPKISEVAVLSASDPLHGEIPKATVVLKDGMKVNRGELMRYCLGRIPRYKVPRIIEFVSELPKSPSGKTLYNRL